MTTATSTLAVQRVLVVDDNVDAAESLAILLQVLGFEARTAHDGLAALELVRGYQPDAIFLDIGLPRMDGYEVARRLRAEPEGRDLFLVALTGHGYDEDRRRALEAGFDQHLVKPIDPLQLPTLLAACAPTSAR